MKKLLLTLFLLLTVGASAQNPLFFQSAFNTATAATPTFSPAAGTYTGTQSVTISSITGGAAFCSTQDGSTPTESGGTCTNGVGTNPTNVTATGTLKAIAYKSGYNDSGVASAPYTISACPFPTAYTSSAWLAYGSGVVCTGGCTGTGNAITTYPDQVGSYNAAGAGGSADPTFTAAAFGSPAVGTAAFNGSSQYFSINGGTGVPVSGTTISMWTTVEPTTGGYQVLASGGSGGLQWAINGSNNQELYGIGEIGAGTATLPTDSHCTSGKCVIGFEFNTVNGNFNFYIFQGGVAYSDGSGSGSPETFTNMVTIGANASGGQNYNGLIPATSLYVSTSGWGSTGRTAIATYVSCKLGI